MKNATYFFIILLLCASVTISFAQKVIQVEAGDEALANAYAGAEAGDIIELVTSGGVYHSAEKIEIDKTITIRGAHGLAEKPIISTDSPDRPFELENNASFYLSNVMVTGFVDDGVEDVSDSTKYAIRVRENANDNKYKLIVDNVDFDHFYSVDDPPEGYVLRLDDDAPIASEIRFTNCTFTRIGRYAIRARAPIAPPAQFELMVIENCTFAEISSYGIRAEFFPGEGVPPARLYVNHCTFYNVGNDAVRIDDDEYPGDVKLTNSIFMNVNNILDADRGTVLFSDTLNTGGFKIDTLEVVEDIYAEDPEFADADNLDFTVSDFFKSIAIGEDGLPVGDVRWIGRTVHEIAAGDEAIPAAYAAAAPGDIIELITSGGMYHSAEKIDIDKTITIRGAAGLTEKPIITTDSPDRPFELGNNASFTLANVVVTGFVDDGVEDASDSTKYAIRIRENMNDNQYRLIVDNVDFDHFFSLDDPPEGYVVRLDDDAPIATEIRFTNCTFTRVARYGLRMRAPIAPPAQFELLTFQNCTFAGIDSYGMRAEFFQGEGVPTARVFVDHCTFYLVGNDAIRVDDNEFPADLKATNCIFMDVNNILDADRGTALYCDTLNTGGFKIDTLEVIENIYAEDPEFADPGNYNFMVSDFFKDIAVGSDGVVVGDVNWAFVSTGVATHKENLPSSFSLKQNYPNPFNPATSINYTLNKDIHVKLSVYNILGQKIKTLVDKQQSAGQHMVQWDGKNDIGNQVSTGVYMYKLEAGDYTKTLKMLLLR
ncbi:T9SS type A sorting domain-containing protein [candidate division KSB1 bacterium]|nr:T9SS type A sorting domain-containing protein [candidate division KSB1 bacterium]